MAILLRSRALFVKSSGKTTSHQLEYRFFGAKLERLVERMHLHDTTKWNSRPSFSMPWL
jgi:hypothetical protein